jgi:hypothetical protein
MKTNQAAREYQYTTCCVNAQGEDITAMVDVERKVTLATIRRHCAGFADWCEQMGYERGGLTIGHDWAVSYYRSIYRGEPCYFVRHSAIEYIWTPGGYNA